MQETSTTQQCRDLAGTCGSTLLWWGPGVALMLITGSMGWWPRVAGWSLALAWFGALCLVNARRCGRLHCYFTGPFFLILAAVVLAVGFRFISFGSNTWGDIVWAAVVGCIALTTLPELIWGRYRRGAGARG